MCSSCTLVPPLCSALSVISLCSSRRFIMCVCFYLWSLLVWLGAEGLDFCPSPRVCLMVVGLNGTAVPSQGQPPKAPSDYYLLPLINVHFLWPCTHARARSGWIQPDPRCRKSINTIEVLISPPLWTICSFKSHLAGANLTFANEDLGSSRHSFLWFLIFKWISLMFFYSIRKMDELK